MEEEQWVLGHRDPRWSLALEGRDIDKNTSQKRSRVSSVPGSGVGGPMTEDSQEPSHLLSHP